MVTQAPPEARGYRFEPMREEDLDDILVIERAIFAEDAWSRGMFVRELKIPFAICWVLRRDEAPRSAVGYVCWRELGDEWELLNVAVAPELRRRGLGSRMVERLLRAARRKGAEKVHLEVREDNAAARALYERHGFAPVGLRRHYYGRDSHALLMAWSNPGRNCEQSDVDSEKPPD